MMPLAWPDKSYISLLAALEIKSSKQRYGYDSCVLINTPPGYLYR